MSPRQQALVAAINHLTDKRGFPPSVAELARELGVSKTRVEQLALACQQRGVISHERRVARSWRVLPRAKSETKVRAEEVQLPGPLNLRVATPLQEHHRDAERIPPF